MPNTVTEAVKFAAYVYIALIIGKRLPIVKEYL